MYKRQDDLHGAFLNPNTSLIAAIRGGYGSNYLLSGLNLELIRRHPKPFLGYSDLTAVQLYLLDQLGLPAFHGPMVAADFDREDGVHMPSFLAALAGQPYGVSPAEGLRLIKTEPVSYTHLDVYKRQDSTPAIASSTSEPSAKSCAPRCASATSSSPPTLSLIHI